MKRAGFTLIEVQVYLAVMALIVVMLCQVALMYHHLYDATARRAQQAVALLAAVTHIRRTFDPSLPNGGFVYNKGKITSACTVILDDVGQFATESDGRGGMWYHCVYGGKVYRWYCAGNR